MPRVTAQPSARGTGDRLVARIGDRTDVTFETADIDADGLSNDGIAIDPLASDSFNQRFRPPRVHVTGTQVASLEPYVPAEDADPTTPIAGHRADIASDLLASRGVDEQPDFEMLPDSVDRPVFANRTRLGKVELVPSPSKPSPQVLAYAAPDEPAEKPFPVAPKRTVPWPAFGGKRVAYYDISAGKVYMPNGDSLEAHSGSGSMRDKPQYVNVKMRGPTPPSTYKLSMRETLFHGVAAIRLTPTDGVNPHGRVGLLAHTYLRRVPGDSAGCVVFKDYKKFLSAFKRGEVSQLVVVPRMSAVASLTGGPSIGTRIASLFTGTRDR